MKASRGKRTQRVDKVFTDRKEPRNAFWNMYHLISDEIEKDDANIHVLTYYGIGGIGKSTLINKLISELKEEVKEPKYVSYDFDAGTNIESVLMSLKGDLTEKYKMTFPLFDIGLLSFYRKSGKDAESKEIKSLVDRSPFFEILLDLGGTIGSIVAPIVGIAPAVVKFLDKEIAKGMSKIGGGRELKKFKEYIDEHMSDLIDIDNSTAVELLNLLPYLFAIDLDKNLEKTKEPLVIFLDTYEQLVNEMSSVGEPLKADLWLRGELGIIPTTANVLWVIAGREMLKWKKFDADWESALEQWLLGDLSDTDSVTFLKESGIYDEELCRQLYILTNGTPKFLGICVDTYRMLIENNGSARIEDFGNNVDELAECFVRYMDDNKKDISSVLSMIRRWDDDFIDEMIYDILPSFSHHTYEKVKGFSFVIENEDGTYEVHKTVGGIFINQCPASLKNKTYKKLIAYYEEQIKEMGTYSPKYAEGIAKLIEYVAAVAESDREVLDYYMQKLREECRMIARTGFDIYITQILNQLYEIAGYRKESLLYALALLEDVIFDLNTESVYDRYKKSVRAHELFELHLGKDNKLTNRAKLVVFDCMIEIGKKAEVIEKMPEMIEKYRRAYGVSSNVTNIAEDTYLYALESAGKYSEMYAYAEAVRKQREGNPECSKDSVNAVYHCLSNYYTSVGKYDLALEFQRKRTDLAKSIYGENSPVIIDYKMDEAELLVSLGKTEEAIKELEKLSEESKANLGEGNRISITVELMLISLMIPDNRIDKSAKELDIAIDKSKALLEVCHESISESDKLSLDVCRLLAWLYLKKESPDEAEAVNQHIEEQLKIKYGEGHSNSAYSKINSGYVELERKNYEGALDIFSKVYEEEKKLLGDDNIMTVRAHRCISIPLNKLERYDEALEILIDCLYKIMCIFDNKATPESIDLCKNIANGMFRNRQMDAHIDFRLKTYEQCLELYGENDLETLDAEVKLSRAYNLSEEYDKALNHAEHSYLMYKELCGSGDNNTLYAMKTIADILYYSGRYDASIKKYTELDESINSGMEEFRELKYKAKRGIFICLDCLERYDEAIEMSDSLIETSERLYGRTSEEALELRVRTAFILGETEIWEEALDFDANLLNDLIDIKGEYDEDTLEVALNLLIARYCLGQDEDYPEYMKMRELALELALWILDKREKVAESDSDLDLILAQFNVGVGYEDTEKYEEAYKLYSKVVSQAEKGIINENIDYEILRERFEKVRAYLNV